MSVMYCVNEYANMIKNDGNIEREELKNMLKLEIFLNDKYKSEKKLNEITDKIYAKVDRFYAKDNKDFVKISSKEKAKQRLELYNKGLDDDEIAEIEGCSVGYIGQWRIKNGLPKHKDNRRKSLEELHIKRMALYNKGLTDEEIAQELGLKKKTISYWRQNQKLKMNKKENENDNNKSYDNIY